MMQISPNAMIPLAHISVSDRDFNVYISLCITSRNMHIFKYNDHSCDYEVFGSEGAAVQWISKPLT
jgi:hypothetical protein